jgi:hypothetical protein
MNRLREIAADRDRELGITDETADDSAILPGAGDAESAEPATVDGDD